MPHHSLGVDYASIDGNGVPNFATAHAAGLRFAVIRGSAGLWHDPTAARDRDAIRAAGIVYGAYFACKIEKTAPAAADQVAEFAKAAGLKPGVDLAPAIDIEFSHDIVGTGMSIPEIVQMIGALITEMTRTFGCKPIIYSSTRVLDGHDRDTLGGAADHLFADCPLWLARYPYRDLAKYDAATLDGFPPPPVPAIADADGWWIHQYQGDAKGFPTIRQTDLDRFNPATSATAGTRRAWMCARLAIAGASTDEQLDAAIRAFQDKHALVVDGVVGPATFAALSWEA